jgi:hypothetical protein
MSGDAGHGACSLPEGARDGICRLGQPWLVLEGVSDHYVAIDFAAEVRRFRP